MASPCQIQRQELNSPAAKRVWRNRKILSLDLGPKSRSQEGQGNISKCTFASNILPAKTKAIRQIGSQAEWSSPETPFKKVECIVSQASLTQIQINKNFTQTIEYERHTKVWLVELN